MCQAVDRLSICSDNNLICKYVRNIRIDISVRWKCLPISLYKCAHADRTQQEKWKTFFAARRWFVVALAWLLIYQQRYGGDDGNPMMAVRARESTTMMHFTKTIEMGATQLSWSIYV